MRTPAPASHSAITRIAISTNTLNAGGAESQRIELANGLAAQGNSVTLYCLQQRGVLADRLHSSVKVIVTTWKTYVGSRYDVIITGTTNTELAFAMISRLFTRKIRWLVVVHNPVGERTPKLKAFSQLAIQFSDGISALSPQHADQIQKKWHTVADYITPNGIDTSNAERLRSLRSNTNNFKYDIGFIGRISMHHKGLDRLFSALAEPAAQGLRLAIAGVGDDTPALKKMANDLGLDNRVEWLGHQNPNEFLTQIKVLVLPSRFEAQPMVLLEAQAINVPVVATVETNATDVGTNCTVVEYENPTTFAEVLYAVVACEKSQVTHTSMPLDISEMTDNYVKVIAALNRSSNAKVKRLVVYIFGSFKEALVRAKISIGNLK